MSVRAILAGVIAGCSGGGATVTPDAGPRDAAIGIDAQQCFGVNHYCFTAPPTGQLVLRDTIDTSTDPRCAAGNASVCLIGAGDIVITQLLLVTGARPLVLVGRAIQVDGAVRLVRSTAAAGTCVAPAGPMSRGGGAGGSFGTIGGNGGNPQNQTGGSVASPAIVPSALRGGCPGNADDATTGLTAGAIGLVATERITIFSTSFIDACGGAGLGAQQPFAGGGGGGSGGMVLLDAPMIEIDGAVLAIGGGGGAGSTSALPGSSGTTGCTGVAAITSPGGSGPNGKGGDGATTASGAAGGNSISGSGGGGGGAGVILIHGTTSGSGAIVPPKTAL